MDASDAEDRSKYYSYRILQILDLVLEHKVHQHLQLQTMSSTTVYVKVEYKIDSGSYQTASANLSISAGATRYVCLTQNVLMVQQLLGDN